MLIQEQNKKITEVINKIYNYINSNLNLKKDLADYYDSTNTVKTNKRDFNNYTLNYIFERKIGQNKKTIFDFALSDINNLTQEEREIINMLQNNTIEGIFEVRKILHNEFELFNITNEKTYVIKPMDRIVKFKNLGVGHFLFARLLKLDNEYYLYHVIEHITYVNRLKAFQLAVSRLAKNPTRFYFDNPQKLEELKESSKNLTEKFQSLFNSNYVTTSNKKADGLIGLLNDYIETNEKPADIDNFICPIEENTYFDIGELRTGDNILAEAKKGFSSQDKEYNVTLLADEKSGLHIVPFMDIFMDIYAREDYTNIADYENCVKKIVTDRKIPPLALAIVNEKYPDIFLKRTNEILGTSFNSLDEILHEYKQFFLENEYVSSTLTLYSSYAFQRLVDVIDEYADSKPKIKVGRNDPCPCGSGLKYKKCCGLEVQI